MRRSWEIFAISCRPLLFLPLMPDIARLPFAEQGVDLLEQPFQIPVGYRELQTLVGLRAPQIFQRTARFVQILFI